MWANAERDGRPAEYIGGTLRYGAITAENVYIMSQPGDGKTSCKVWLASVERRRCSNKAKT